MKPSRRDIVVGVAALSTCRGMAGDNGSKPFRLAVCNETFQGADFPSACRLARETGYSGLEIAPFTLSEDPIRIPASKRAEYRRSMNSEGVTYVGLHSLLTTPKWLHVTTPDQTIRNKTWDYFRGLIDLSADLGSGGVMVLGSGKQRNAIDGTSVEDATKRLRDGLARVAPHAQDKGVLLLPEPLAPHLSNVLTSFRQAVELVREIDNPAVQTIFDTHNAVAEELPHDQLINKYGPYIRHAHVNEIDGRYPGTGSYDFSVPLRALKEIGYNGWVSLEVFDFKPSGEVVARESAKYLRAAETRLSGATRAH